MKKTMNDTSEKPADYTQQKVKDQAHNILKVWKANREFRMQDTKFEDFDKVTAEFDERLEKIETRSRELNELRTAREKLASKLSLLNTRARSGMRGYFGPQSSEFARVKVLQSHKAVRKVKKSADRKAGVKVEPAEHPRPQRNAGLFWPPKLRIRARQSPPVPQGGPQGQEVCHRKIRIVAPTTASGHARAGYDDSGTVK